MKTSICVSRVCLSEAGKCTRALRGECTSIQREKKHGVYDQWTNICSKDPFRQSI